MGQYDQYLEVGRDLARVGDRLETPRYGRHKPTNDPLWIPGFAAFVGVFLEFLAFTAATAKLALPLPHLALLLSPFSSVKQNASPKRSLGLCQQALSTVASGLILPFDYVCKSIRPEPSPNLTLAPHPPHPTRLLPYYSTHTLKPCGHAEGATLGPSPLVPWFTFWRLSSALVRRLRPRPQPRRLLLLLHPPPDPHVQRRPLVSASLAPEAEETETGRQKTGQRGRGGGRTGQTSGHVSACSATWIYG